MSAWNVTFGVKTRSAFVIVQVMTTVENCPRRVVEVFRQSRSADEHDDDFSRGDSDQTATESNTVTRSQRWEQSATNFWWIG